MKRYTVGLALALLLMMGTLSAQGPFVYFAGNPANSWYTVGGTCDAPTLTANYLYFIFQVMSPAQTCLPAEQPSPSACITQLLSTRSAMLQTCLQGFLRFGSGSQGQPPILKAILFRI